MAHVVPPYWNEFSVFHLTWRTSDTFPQLSKAQPQKDIDRTTDTQYPRDLQMMVLLGVRQRYQLLANPQRELGEILEAKLVQGAKRARIPIWSSFAGALRHPLCSHLCLAFQRPFAQEGKGVYFCYFSWNKSQFPRLGVFLGIVTYQIFEERRRNSSKAFWGRRMWRNVLQWIHG